MAIYLKFGSVNGGVMTKAFEKWIECSSFAFGVQRFMATAARSSTNREGSEPQFADVTLTKTFDVSSIKLMEDAWGGHLGTKAEIKFTTTTKDGVATFLTYVLENCGLASYHVSGQEQGNPQESISLNFTTIKVTHTGTDTKIGGSAGTVGYDLTKMSKM